MYRKRQCEEFEAHIFDNHNNEDDYDYKECCDDSNEEPTYDRYQDSYVQGEMGYSDDDIDTIFDGEPDAYWNID